MKSVKYRKYGDPSVIEIVETKKTELDHKDILVKNYASLVTPSDCVERQGKPYMIRIFSGILRPKHTPGNAIAGIVEKVGKDVNKFKVGDRVYGSTGVEAGSHSQYLCLDENISIVKMPKTISFGEAAAISEGVLTALPFLKDRAKLEKGMRILINGASGNIGSTAIQLARLMGAHVTGVCSGKNESIVKKLGAHEVIDYTKEDFTSRIDQYHVIFDAIGKNSFFKCSRSLTENGLYMTTVPSLSFLWQLIWSKIMGKKRSLFGAMGLRNSEEKISDLLYLNDQIDQGTLKALIDREYSLEDINRAHQYVDLGHKVGSVVINLAE